MAAHRTCCKLLWVLLGVFTELAHKGFCLPPEIGEELAKEGATKFEDIEDGGLGEGEGAKDVSDKIETEDQLEDTVTPNQPKKDEETQEHKDLKDEEHGIEMSDDFQGELYDADKSQESEDNETSDEEENNKELDKQMGDVGEDLAEQLDEKLWGDDEEDESDDLKEENEFGKGEEQIESDLVPKEQDQGRQKQKDMKEQGKDPSKDDDGRNDMDKINDQDNEEEYQGETEDPYRNAEQPQEPQDSEFPEDLNLDQDEEGMGDDDDKGDKENAMDVDEMKEESTKDENIEENNPVNDTDEVEDDEVLKSKEDETEETKNGIQQEEGTENPEEPGTEPDKEEDGFMSSFDKAAQQEAIDASQDQVTGSKDNVQSASVDKKRSQPQQEGSTEKEQHGSGEAEGMEEVQGHEADYITSVHNPQEQQQGRTRKHHRTSQNSNKQRTLGKLEEIPKNIDVMDVDEEPQECERQQAESELYRHVAENEGADAEAMDIATEEQAAEKPFPKDENKTEEDFSDNMLVPEDEENANASEAGKTIQPRMDDKGKRSKENQVDKTSEDVMDETDMDVPGDKVPTYSVERGQESTIHTRHDLWSRATASQDVENVRAEFEFKLGLFNENVSLERPKEAEELWALCERTVAPMVQELCEQLRLVLEPTKSSKLKGDYRTGKRLNMRKVITYIASQFRKDKIWLRRTKPSQRQYHIMLAIDNSSSMADNQSRQLAFESLALLGKSLSLLEAGELSVVSFGSDVRVLHPLGEPFTDSVGAKILQHFCFDQQKTCIAQMLNYATSTMLEARRSISRGAVFKETSQLLVIISDGRGLFNEGEDVVKQAVRRIQDSSIFTVFVVLDNPKNKDSIFDIRVPVFQGVGKVLKIHSYMENFPFPFYIVLRDISAMPIVLGEALHQWFDFVTSSH